MQGNSAEPVLWIIISIILVRHLYLKGLSIPQCSPTSKLIFNLIALMLVDNIDLKLLKIEGKFTLEVMELG